MPQSWNVCSPFAYLLRTYVYLWFQSIPGRLVFVFPGLVVLCLSTGLSCLPVYLRINVLYEDEFLGLDPRLLPQLQDLNTSVLTVPALWTDDGQIDLSRVGGQTRDKHGLKADHHHDSVFTVALFHRVTIAALQTPVCPPVSVPVNILQKCSVNFLLYVASADAVV